MQKFEHKKHLKQGILPYFRCIWRRERDLNPCYPYGGKHDFESCAFDRSAISAKNPTRKKLGQIMVAPRGLEPRFSP